MTESTPSPPSAFAPQLSPKVRVPFWDNTRFVAVTLVVIGHGIQRLTADSDPALSLYLFIFAFHMPAFAIISGYFSKSDPPNRVQITKVITDILLPYLIMEAIWSVVKFLVKGSVDFNPTTASWTLWFLLALAIFRLVLPYLALLRWPLAWAVLFSVAIGYWANVDSTFSLARAFGILPFFVLGWKLRQWGIMDWWLALDRGRSWVRVGAAVVLGGWLVTAFVFVDQFRAFRLGRWFFYDSSYADLDAAQWWAGFARLGFLGMATVLSFALFALVPRRETWITDFGQATMYVYLLHTFVLYPVRESGILGGENSSVLWVAGMVLVSILVSLLLSTRIVRRVFRPIIEPKPRWLFLAADPRTGT
ncbi:MAG: acyltransferase family protein [Rhodoglobus sp.]